MTTVAESICNIRDAGEPIPHCMQISSLLRVGFNVTGDKVLSFMFNDGSVLFFDLPNKFMYILDEVKA